uniref:Uncharacterized protein n=1 Tax=Caudovirales sp. ctrNG92 TaxID=2827638 RepID=A0A8S5SE63_9CAUD|nr:MAG TPA: hypothetical protein [Caudovirales sp. ctrNG92]
MVLLVCDATDTHRSPGLKRPGFFESCEREG